MGGVHAGRAAVAAALLVAGISTAAPAAIRWTGVNLAGAEFGVSNGNVNLPGTYNTHYTYPTSAEVTYLSLIHI